MVVIPGRHAAANPESIIAIGSEPRGPWLWIPALASLARNDQNYRATTTGVPTLTRL
jgi:hypothetical protein